MCHVPRALALALVLPLSATACGRYELAARWNELRGDAYVLDTISRDIPEAAAPSCPEHVRSVVYRGELIPYQPPAQVAEPFAEKLRAFDRVVEELAREHYGRAPDRVLHFGASLCRSVRGNTRRLSEHALGNALDLAGFRWRKLPAAAGASHPHAFSVTVQRHWAPREQDADGATHRAFLQALLARIRERNLFRGVIGPGREGHADHLHLDQAPWSYWLF